ncbi:YihY/virulence factor BrkB family protein [Cohnella endophytica]|uniref:YihY/virulence factor BrkB family protein n=1 Tax=Cohnella endophytica TaxID=2419778 RepID=A0A494XYT3_9BACL|nr:YihY/virulence factor BrkB family protein [Cohnella endophytica]RKP54209.1 YihY/virulence factor BrkB family protein [Cohnella endophytica]
MNNKNRTTEFVRCMISRFQEDDLPALAAQLTYYLILAFFPFLIFVVSIVGFAHLTTEDLMGELSRVLPSDTADAVRSIVDEVTANENGTLLSIGMLATIWAASNGMNAIIKGLNKAYDEEETRPFWKVRGLSVVATIVLAIVILISMLMLVFGRIVGEWLFRRLDYPSAFPWTWGFVKLAIPLVAMLGVFMLLYRHAPNRRLNWSAVVPGTLFTTIGWIISSLAFAFYVNHFANYTKTYGSIGGIIVLLVWLYLSSIIVLLGGEVNATLAFAKEGKTKCESKKFGLRLPWLNNKTG